MAVAVPGFAQVQFSVFDHPVAAMAQSPVDSGVLFVVSGDRLHASTDGGVKWSSGSLPGLPAGERTLIGDAGNRLGVFLLVTKPCRSDAEESVHYSPDAGSTWRDMAAGFEPQAGSFAQDPARPARLILADRKGNLRSSSDRGKTWAVLEQERFAGTCVGSVVVSRNGPKTILATSVPWESPCPCGAVLRSTDGGNHWTRTAPVTDSGGEEVVRGVMLLHASPVDSNTVWASEAFLALVSKDGGATWTEMESGYEARARSLWNVLPDPQRAGTVYTYADRVWRGTEFGSRWEVVLDPGMPVDGLAIAGKKGGREFVWASGRSLYRAPMKKD